MHGLTIYTHIVNAKEELMLRGGARPMNADWDSIFCDRLPDDWGCPPTHTHPFSAAPERIRDYNVYQGIIDAYSL
jgi:hypothetical protein